MPKLSFACVQCGKTFERFPSQAKAAAYCSLSCRSRHRSEVFMPLKPRRGDTIPCDVCGKEVYRCPGEIKRDRRFCSTACKDVGQRKDRIHKQCPTCGKDIELKPSQASITYCSKACEGIGRTVRPLNRTHNGRTARMDNRGYILVWEPDHPNKSMKGWQLEHRIVVEAVIGRYLKRDEHVHHINGVKDDNRPENLEMMDHLDHARLSSHDYREQVRRERAELEEYRRRFGALPKTD